MAEVNAAAARAALGQHVPGVDLDDPVAAAVLAPAVVAGWRPPIPVAGETAGAARPAPTPRDPVLFPVAAP